MPKGRVDPTRLVAPYPTLPLELRRRKLRAHELQAELENKNAELKQKDALIKKQQDEPIQKTRLVQQLQSALLSIDQSSGAGRSREFRSWETSTYQKFTPPQKKLCCPYIKIV